MHALNNVLNNVHSSWHNTLSHAQNAMDPDYLQALKSADYLPDSRCLYNAFSISKEQVRFILFGESPYPRKESANGYAFWDQRVHALWSSTGLSTAVNRATSLRNFIKMLLIASKRLDPNDLSQAAIAALKKEEMIQTNDELFQGLLKHGFLLLNASLIFRKGQVADDAKQWFPFIKTILESFLKQKNKPKLLLFGKIAGKILQLEAAQQFPSLIAEHPYNLSFAQNKGIINEFEPLQLLEAKSN
jgi:uracil-DNA glycosylase